MSAAPVSELHKAARAWAKLGFHVFPCVALGKEPACAHGVNEATTDLATIDAWWANADYNIGVAPDRSGHFVLDQDGPAGAEALGALQLEHGLLPETRTFSTPRGEDHLHFWFKGSCPSSVAKLGPKTDTRGQGGYVLVPPSRVEDASKGIDGCYKRINEAPIAESPPWIAEKLAALKEHRAADSNVALDQPHNLDRAASFLRDAPPAIEGEGGDAKTYEIAASVMQLGVSPGKTLELMQAGYNGRCEPPWSDDDLAQKIQNAADYMQNEIGAWAVPPAAEIFKDFIASLKNTVPAAPSGTSWSFGTFDAVEDSTLPPITYRDPAHLWIDIPEGCTTQVLAKAKGLKTAWVMAEMFSLMQTAAARVLILALEGRYGARTSRLQALAKFHNVPLVDLRGRFAVMRVESGGIFDLTSADCVNALIAWLRTQNWTDLIIDTQFRAAGSLDENSASDARILWNAVELIRERAHVNLILLHHFGKDRDKGGRGSSADPAAVDQVIELTRDAAAATLEAKVTARKDGPDGFSVFYRVQGGEGENSNTPPIPVRITEAEYGAAKGKIDLVAPSRIAAALADMNVRGEAAGVTTRVLATRILELAEILPSDPQKADAQVSKLDRAIRDAATTSLQVRCYGQKDGDKKTAPWKWFLPSENAKPGFVS